MESTKSPAAESPQPASISPNAPDENTAYTPPSLPAPSPATGAQKRRCEDVEDDGPAVKRHQGEPPSALTPATSPKPLETTPHTPVETRDFGSQTAVSDSERDSRIQGDNRSHDLDSRGHETQDLSPGQPYHQPTTPLSKANLRQLQEGVVASEDMSSGVTSDRGRKRASSRQTSNSDLLSATSTTRSKEPTPSHNFYRYHILRRARIQIHSEPPPRILQLNAIFHREVTKETRSKITDTAEETSREFARLLEGAHREDDLVELVHKALFAIHREDSLSHPRKAGKKYGMNGSALQDSFANPHTDWNPNLKPVPQKPLWDFDALGPPLAASADRPNKRQQAVRPLPSPDTSLSTMALPPPAPPFSVNANGDHIVSQGAVKTPRPDFSCGLQNVTIANALQNRGLNKSRADDLLDALQLQGKVFSNPTQQFLDLRFPFLVIEGKAYTTGRTLFEAENQAAVSGSSMLIVQQQLTDLYNTIPPSSEDRHSPVTYPVTPPLAFSVCTQGPILELWVHHVMSQEDVTMYHMNLLTSCHGSLCEDLERFILKVNCLIEWYKHDYFGKVTDQLFAIASHFARRE
ncbi:MAG: hypothetical protein Q9206_007306 [Seirophora lacunosa]